MDIQIAVPSRAGNQSEVTTMKVWPKDDAIRTIITHPTHGAFAAPPSADPADWPNDTFTFRRIRDGDVLEHDPRAPKVEKKAKEDDARPAQPHAKEK